MQNRSRYPFLSWIQDSHHSAFLSGAGERILDVGCGPNPAHLKGARAVIGLDPDRDAARRASSAPGVDAICQSITQHLPFDDATFDAVFMRGVLHHVPPSDRQSAIGEVRRVIRPDGRLVVLEPDPTSRYRQLVWHVAALLGYEHEASEHVDARGRGYATPAAIEQACETAGFDVIRQSSAGSLLTPLAFLYPYRVGVGVVRTLYPYLPANWWSVTIARPVP